MRCLATRHDGVMEFAADGPWELPVIGFEVGRLTFGPNIELHLDGDDHQEVQVRLTGPFDFQDAAGGTFRLDPATEAWEKLRVLLELGS
jgi:hypothetical protein